MEGDAHYHKIYPNWSALAKVQLPIKRFVTPSEKTQIDELTKTSRKKSTEGIISGTEIKEFYENTVKTISEKQKYCKKIEKQTKDSKSFVNVKVPFDQNRFFRAAMSNDIETLKSFNYNHNNCINSTDMFGWTALMMSACENSIDAFKFLLDNGAKLSKTNTGTSPASIAKQKGYIKILDVINNYEKSIKLKNKVETKHIDNSFKQFYCNICDTEFQETTIKKHETSTVHQFNIKSKRNNSLKYMLSKKNRGLKIMVKQGWDEESGLGPTGSGKLFPIRTVIRKQRSGLGIEQNAAKITHYKPYDVAAIKYKPLPKQKTRNDIQIERKRNQKQERRLRRELS